jgi:hypothetical protein
MLSTMDELDLFVQSIGATRWQKQGDLKQICPKVRDSSRCPIDADGNSPSVLDQFVRNFGASSIELDGLGRIKSEDLPGRTYNDRVFGDFTCVGCLDGVPGSRHPGEERCNATFAVGETLFSVAPKYNIDWMLLWSLNGGDSPDTVTQTGAPYRFAHQYTIQEGDTLASIAHNLATTPEAIMKLNFNRITHFASPRDLLPGTTICVLPSFIDVRDRYGHYLCQAHEKHVGIPYKR